MSGHMCKVAYQTEKLQYWYDGYSDSLTETHFSEEGNCLHGMRMFLPTALIGVLEVAGDRQNYGFPKNQPSAAQGLRSGRHRAGELNTQLGFSI